MSLIKDWPSYSFLRPSGCWSATALAVNRVKANIMNHLKSLIFKTAQFQIDFVQLLQIFDKTRVLLASDAQELFFSAYEIPICVIRMSDFYLNHSFEICVGIRFQSSSEWVEGSLKLSLCRFMCNIRSLSWIDLTDWSFGSDANVNLNVSNGCAFF